MSAHSGFKCLSQRHRQSLLLRFWCMRSSLTRTGKWRKFHLTEYLTKLTAKFLNIQFSFRPNVFYTPRASSCVLTTCSSFLPELILVWYLPRIKHGAHNFSFLQLHICRTFCLRYHVCPGNCDKNKYYFSTKLGLNANRFHMSRVSTHTKHTHASGLL